MDIGGALFCLLQIKGKVIFGHKPELSKGGRESVDRGNRSVKALRWEYVYGVQKKRKEASVKWSERGGEE